MHAFDYAQALSVEHAVTLLAQAHGRARVLSGGTDLIVALREGKLETDLVVDVKRINEISALDYDPSEGLYIGASVPCHRIYNHTEIARGFAGLIDAAQLIGGVQVQGRASLGGNLCNASPAADSIPALIVHSAICDIAGPQGRRHVPVEDFCSAPGRTILQPGELLVALRIPAPQPGFGAAYLRFIPRNEMDIAVVGVGASVQLDESRTTITGRAHCAGCSCADAALRGRGRRGTDRPGAQYGGDRPCCGHCPRCRPPNQRHARHGRVSPPPGGRAHTAGAGQGYRAGAGLRTG
jgi:CO/xanthine dehydrogenase FAD-binding subunit